jgi:hypothetical protein
MESPFHLRKRTGLLRHVSKKMFVLAIMMLVCEPAQSR